MDLLYSRYSNPLEFMRLYMEQGRFGEFVANIISMDKQRKKEAAEKDDEDKLFNMYLHSMPDKSFNDWKKEVLKSTDKNKQSTTTMTKEDQKEQAIKIINDSTKILDDFILN